MNMTRLDETELLAALADPTRLRIVMLILDNELCVCDLTAVLDLPQSTISRHLGRLRTNGIVRDRREGKWVHYSLEPGSIGSLAPFLESISDRDPFLGDRQRLASRTDRDCLP